MEKDQQNEQQSALVETEEKRIAITSAQVELIKHTVAVGATDEELKLFFYECRRRGVHPLDRLIHFVKRGEGPSSKAAFQCSIDFMRSQAEASGEYRGQNDVQYGPLVVIEGHKDLFGPEWAKATVIRRDHESGESYMTSATVYWNEFYPGEKMGFMWRKMPRLMLGKVAEAQALRKAFPRQLQGLYSFEEMEQADIPYGEPKKEIKAPQSRSEAVKAPKKAAIPPTAEVEPDRGAPCTSKQQGAIHAIARQAGIPDNDLPLEINTFLRELLPDDQQESFIPIESTKDLTIDQASNVIKFLGTIVDSQKAG